MKRLFFLLQALNAAYVSRGVFRSGTFRHVRRPLTPVGAVVGEAIFRSLRPKEGQQRFYIEGAKVFSQKRSTKIALGTGGALSTALPLGNNVRPLGVVPP